MRLRHSEFVPWAPDDPGVGRVNHDTPHCRGSSKSIRVTRHDDGSITAKCFRCGAVGWDGHDVGSVVSIKRTLSAPVGTGVQAEERGRVLGDLVGDTGEWPIRAYQWVRQYGLTLDEIKTYGIMYALQRQRIYLPVWWKGEKVGYQLRRIFDDDHGPKYDSRIRGGVGFMSFGCVPNNTVVVVEDIISAIKVGRHEQAVALLSTGLTNATKAVLSQYDRFVVWLDNDNPQVITAAVKILKYLQLFGDAKLLQTEKDPKEYSDEELKRILYAT